MSDGPPIFIVGCPRSGTTLVRQILDSHSRIACPGETSFLVGLLAQLRNGLVAEGLERLGISRAEAVAHIRAHALNYFEGYLYRSGKARWADKTPIHGAYCDEILEVFGPQVLFVHLLRDGLDVVNSMIERTWMALFAPGVTDPLKLKEVAARTWMLTTDAFARFEAAHPDLCLTVRFEDLTSRPETVMRGVIEFLGERWEPRILDYRAFPHSGSGDVKTPKQRSIHPNSGKFRSWAPEHVEVIRALLATHLERYGYGDTAG